MCRILAIAPYESMRNLIVNLCADRPEIQLTALVGDLEEGAKLVQTIPSEDYDIIISRGGTAEIIRTVTSIPVIDISLSSYDVLSTIRLVENYPGKSAIVAYPSISKIARLICGVLQSDIPVYTLDSAQHLHGLIQSLNAQGFSLIIGDAVTTAYAQRCSLDAVLITSGIESLESTLNEALYIYELLSVQGAKEGLLRKITQGGNTYYAILDSKGNFCWENAALKEKHKLRQFFKNFITTVSALENRDFSRKIGGEQYAISYEYSYIHNEKYYLFTAQPLQTDGGESQILTVYTANDISPHYFTNYANSFLRSEIEQYALVNIPILIIGESGTSKNKVANALYSNSPYKEWPLYVVNCARATPKFWQSFTNQPNSVLFSQRMTIFFQNAECLSESQCSALLRHIRTNSGNKYLFSVVTDGKTADDIPICRYATQEEFVYLRLPPLRDRIHEIPALATLYTSEFNTRLSKQVIGFLPEALDVLMGYSWPGNLNQFRRIVKELILQTAGPYITADMVRNLLRQEGAGTFSASPAESINIDQPLDDIIYDVVCRQLAQSKQNQTKVAEKLGISRTTLWRILQRKRKDS